MGTWFPIDNSLSGAAAESKGRSVGGEIAVLLAMMSLRKRIVV